jgi:hypothetical protein
VNAGDDGGVVASSEAKNDLPNFPSAATPLEALTGIASMSLLEFHPLHGCIFYLQDGIVFTKVMGILISIKWLRRLKCI